jgi:hypothetical protein
MRRVTGIGGVLFNAKDPKTLCAWYKQHLGIDVQDWGGTAFAWTDAAGNPAKGTTVWSIGAADGNHFAPSKSTSWSTIESRTWPPCFKHYATKAATCLKRQTTLSTGSSDGSWTLKATRSSSGSHRLGSERSLRPARPARLLSNPTLNRPRHAVAHRLAPR